MKTSDVVKQLRAVLPVYTDLFNSTLGITTISQVGTTVTATFDDTHSFTVGEQIVINNVSSPITISSITRLDGVGTATTATAHDITFNPTFPVHTTVTLSGSIEPEFNGTFNLLSSNNRLTFTFEMPDSGPTAATGSPLLEDPPTPIGYNGSQVITLVPATNQVQYELPVSGLLAGIVSASSVVNFDIRIAGAVNLERAQQMYTAQSANDLWAFVVLGDTVASKDRTATNDAVTSAGKGGDRKQQIYQGMSVHVFVPSSDEVSGADARDIAEGIMSPLFKSLLYWSAPTGLVAEDDMGLHFDTHRGSAYEVAYYVHEFVFQTLLRIYREDTIEPENDVAFRDIDFSFSPSVGDGILTGAVDLDLVPVP